MNNIFVYCEYEDGAFADVSLELLTKGRELADTLGCKLEAIVLGHNLKGVEKELAKYGADTVWVADDKELAPYRTLPHSAILCGVFKEEKPQIALMGATQRVLQLAFVPIWGMSQGLQPAAGTNYGAKQYRRVKTMTNVFIAGSTVLALVFFAVMQLFPQGILSAFITDPYIVEQGLGNFRLMYSVFPTYGLLIMTMTFFQALGKGAKAGMVVMLRQIALIVPLVLILPRFLGITGVWLAIPANDAIVLVLALVLLAGEYRNLTKLEKGVMPLPSAA